jgi:hypothetical protein
MKTVAITRPSNLLGDRREGVVELSKRNEPKKTRFSKPFRHNPLILLDRFQGNVWKKFGKSLDTDERPLKTKGIFMSLLCPIRIFQAFPKSASRPPP